MMQPGVRYAQPGYAQPMMMQQQPMMMQPMMASSGMGMSMQTGTMGYPPISWMPPPPPMPGVPPGLEYLNTLDRLSIQQQMEILEGELSRIFGPKINDKYKVQLFSPKFESQIIAINFANHLHLSSTEKIIISIPLNYKSITNDAIYKGLY